MNSSIVGLNFSIDHTADVAKRMIEIPLTKGYVAVIDEQDADLALYKWIADVNKSGNVYARRARPKGESGGRKIHMHRVILERVLGRPLLKSEDVDHWNGNGVDNSRDNIRLASRIENTRNQKTACDSISGYKGVGFRSENGTWRVRIEVADKRISLGTYSTPEEAACIYNYYAVQYFGEFAWLNDVPNWEEKAKSILAHSRVRRDNTSGFTGVSRKYGLWVAQVNINKKPYAVGTFDTPEKANEARLKFVAEMTS